MTESPSQDVKMEESPPKTIDIPSCSKDIKLLTSDRTGSYGFVEKEGITLPFVNASSRPKEHYETKHDVPPPAVYGADVATNHEMNEWILNHLPLKEEEKKAMLHDLRKEYLKQKKTEKRMKNKLKRRIPKKKDTENPNNTKGRTPLKDT